MAGVAEVTVFMALSLVAGVVGVIGVADATVFMALLVIAGRYLAAELRVEGIGSVWGEAGAGQVC